MLGKKVITTYKENVPEGPQTAQVIDALVRDGNKIIFATSFGFMDAMAAAAKKYPDVYFEHATGYKSAKNFANYFGAVEDAIYLAGMAAGAATKNGNVGFIVPFPIPEIIRHTNGFALGRARRPAGREDPARLDEVLVRPGEGAEGRGEPRRRRRRRDRPERRQPVRRPVRAVEGHPVGGSRVEREEVRADLLAHVRALRLGPLLHQARQGGPERHLEDRELLGKHGRRLRGARSVRAEGLGEDAGR